MRTRRSFLFFPLLVCLCGCFNTAEPWQNVETCAEFPGRYSFLATNSRLFAGRSVFDATSLTNPSLSGRFYYSIFDTIFTARDTLYEFHGEILGKIDSIRDYDPFWKVVSFPGTFRHCAVTGNALYMLRHVTPSQSTEFCYLGYDTVNSVEVYDFTDTTRHAVLLSTLSMSDPQGLAIEDKVLYVLDGTNGLLLFDISSPFQPKSLTTLGSVKGYHIQTTDTHTLLVYSTDGISQYDISNPSSPSFVSKVQ